MPKSTNGDARTGLRAAPGPSSTYNRVWGNAGEFGKWTSRNTTRRMESHQTLLVGLGELVLTRRYNTENS